LQNDQTLRLTFGLEQYFYLLSVGTSFLNMQFDIMRAGRTVYGITLLLANIKQTANIDKTTKKEFTVK
jgi:hypothetical protein